ncbi:dUTP diphosphatase [Paenibacillus sp. sgz500958]|uniref:dUTP diphosphatase n=1 Tax=Paenibacillus sp. sgz500958 TaxID=3242475 RepID=UPI0036D2B3C9
MTLTLEQMYEMQKELDAKIIREKGLEGKDLLPNTVLALQVEICELANEWRGFKHWSNDQAPRYENKSIAFANPGGPFEHTSYPLIEEYVDCLHFFLSIARQLDLPADDLYVAEDSLDYETTVVFTELLHVVGLIMGDEFLINTPKNIMEYRRDHLRGALYIFYGLGEQRLGFTFEQIADAYAAKNKINHKRQANGY